MTDLGAMLYRSAGLVQRRSLVVVVSDFISTPGWERALGRLARDEGARHGVDGPVEVLRAGRDAASILVAVTDPTGVAGD